MSQKHLNKLSEVQQEDLNDALVSACERGAISKIGPLVTQGANPQARSGDGLDMPLLHWAAHVGKTDVCLALLDSGADIEFALTVRQSGWTALHYAAAKNRLGTCLALLERGANVNALDGDQNNPLMQISGTDKLEVARLLIAHGADVHAVNAIGNTALHCAGLSKTPAMTALLLEAGSDATLLNIRGMSALGMAESWFADDHCQILKAWLARAAAHQAIDEVKKEWASPW